MQCSADCTVVSYPTYDRLKKKPFLANIILIYTVRTTLYHYEIGCLGCNGLSVQYSADCTNVSYLTHDQLKEKPFIANIRLIYTVRTTLYHYEVGCPDCNGLSAQCSAGCTVVSYPTYDQLKEKPFIANIR